MILLIFAVGLLANCKKISTSRVAAISSESGDKALGLLPMRLYKPLAKRCGASSATMNETANNQVFGVVRCDSRNGTRGLDAYNTLESLPSESQPRCLAFYSVQSQDGQRR